MMELDSLERFIKKKKSVVQIRENIIGHEIKKRRREKNLTQDEVVEGICCISYLSKMENNLIKPNAQYVADILKKMDISNGSLLTTNIFTSYYIAAIKDKYYETTQITKKINEKINGEDISYLTDLFKLIYNVNLQINDDLSFYIERLMLLKENMLEVDLDILLLYLTMYFYQRGNYFEAKRISRLVNENSEIPFFNALLYEYTFLVNLKTCFEDTLLNDWYLINQIGQNTSNTNSLRKIKYAYLEYLLKRKAFALYQRLIDDDTVYQKKISLKVLYLVQMNKSHMAINVLRSFKEKTREYAIYALLVFYNLNDRLHIGQVLSNIIENDYYDYNIDEVHFINMVKLKYLEKNTFELKTYLRDVIIPYYNDQGNILYLYYYTERLIEVLCEEAQYKSAVNMHNRFTKRVNEIRMIAWT